MLILKELMELLLIDQLIFNTYLNLYSLSFKVKVKKFFLQALCLYCLNKLSGLQYIINDPSLQTYIDNYILYREKAFFQQRK